MQTTNLQTLLQRQDIWRGKQHKPPITTGLTTGFDCLDQQLYHGGWPTHGLMEVCETPLAPHWQLMAHSAKAVSDQGAYIALLNPPYQPFAQGLAQNALTLNRIFVVTPQTKNELICCATELSQSSQIQLLMIWEAPYMLSYTDLRKIHLSCLEHTGICALFRPYAQRQNSSPAHLRLALNIQPQHMTVEVFKQQGLFTPHTLELPLSTSWYQGRCHRTKSDTEAPRQHARAMSAQPWRQPAGRSR